jgi:hypothetical protein
MHNISWSTGIHALCYGIGMKSWGIIWAICLYLGRYGDILEYGGQYCPEIVRYSKGFMVWNIPYLIQLCYFRGIMGRYGPEIVKSCQDSWGVICPLSTCIRMNPGGKSSLTEIGWHLGANIVRYSKRYREDCYGIMRNHKGIYGHY